MPDSLPSYPVFITIEGPDGSGKTTQIRLLIEALTERGCQVVATREPGGTRIGNGVRSLILDPAHREMTARTEALLFNAARAQLVDEIVRPALARGAIVLCDRYGDSTMAYQGYGRGQPLGPLQALIEFATGGLHPDLTLFLDVDVAAGLHRKQEDERNRMEGELLAFHQAAREGYHALAAAEPARWLVLDATLPVDALHARILARVLDELGTATQA
ncbi:MAG: dTMP kinase [Caldilineaceae bacterium]